MIKNKLKEIRMREYLMEKGEFAKFLELSDSFYSQLESGKRWASLEKAFEIAQKLNKKVDDIWYI